MHLKWRFVLTELPSELNPLGGAPLGEIQNVYNPKFDIGLSKIDTGQITVRADNAFADHLLRLDCWLKVFRGDDLLFYGPVISAEETGERETTTIVANVAGAGWLLSKRLAGKLSSGQAVSTPTDKAQIAKQIIDDLDHFDPAYLQLDYHGINTTLLPISAASTATYTIGPFKPVLDCINELAAGHEGFDWRIIPRDNYDYDTATKLDDDIGIFTAGALLGTDANEAIFEWNVGRRNILSYKRTVNRDTQANILFHNHPGGPDMPENPTIYYQPAGWDDPSGWRRWGSMEEVVQSELSILEMRQDLVREHAETRKFPREVLTFQPHINPQEEGHTPIFGFDYDVGDRVIARGYHHSHVLFDGVFRVWGVSLTLDENGVERVELMTENTD